MTGMSVFNGFGAGRIDCTELARLAAEKLPETPEQVFAWADALADNQPGNRQERRRNAALARRKRT